MRRTLFVIWVALIALLPAVLAQAEEPPEFILKWGMYGTGDGQFNGPYGIACDSQGNVYVADGENHRIQKFTGDGIFLAKWGTYGSGDGQFYAPRSPAVGADGNVFVSEYHNHRIQKFTGDGTFLTKWGSYGGGDGQFNLANGVAVDNAGNLYVASGWASYDRIQKFTADGAFLTKWGSYGTGDGEFYNPSGAAVDSDGNVYVADFRNHRIQKFTADGTFLTKWGSYGSGDGEFYMPHEVDVDAFDNVYVADMWNDRLQKFTGNGMFLTKWGSLGSGDGQFNRPWDVVVGACGNIYVVDTGNHRIQMFGAVDAPTASLECPANVAVPGFSTIPSLSLVGFRITNTGAVPAAFCYQVTAEGPATLVDKGDPASLSGTTPWLDPGASYYPPEAGLVIPDIREYRQELVTYSSCASCPGYVSCTTVITFEPPVPVFISTFDATMSANGVDLTWDVVSDEEVVGFKIYRGSEGGPAREEVTSSGLIPADARAYTDKGVLGGRTYEYTLCVVLANRSELQSQPVTVKTRLHALALHQNSPNPFNPTTTISFTLPETARVMLSIYDVEGRAVRALVDGTVGEGYREYVWDGRGAGGKPVGSGVYFYRLTVGNRTLTKRMVFLK